MMKIGKGWLEDMVTVVVVIVEGTELILNTVTLLVELLLLLSTAIATMVSYTR